MVNKKQYVIIVIFLILIFSCKKNKNQKKIYINSVIPIFDITYNNSKMNICYSKNKIVYLSKKNDCYIIKFINLNGDIIKKFKINRGKGPGEIVFNWRMKIYKKYIYILDTNINKIIKYNFDGEFIEEIYFNKLKEKIYDFIILDKNIIIEGIYKYKLLKINKRTKQVISKLKYETVLDKKNYFSHSLREGSLFYKKNNIYLGYFNKPFRIDVFNKKLEKIKTIQKNYGKKYKECKWQKHPSGGKAIMGHYMIKNLKVKNNNIYVPFGEGFKYTKKGMEFLDVDNCLYVINKDTNKTIYKLWNKNLPKTGAGYKLLNINQKKIILFTIYDNKTINQLLKYSKKEYNNFPKGVIIVLSKNK